MAKVKYEGPAEVSVPALAELGIVVTPGGVYDVPAALAKRLVHSSAWFTDVKAPAKPKAQPKTKGGDDE